MAQGLRFLVLVVAFWVVISAAVVLAAFAIEAVTRGDLGGGLSLSPEQWISAQLFGLLLAFQLLRLAAPRVGYRSQDALLIFVPVANIYLVVKLLWRVAALPDRYWRSDQPIQE